MPVLFPLQKEDFNSLIWLLEHSPFNDLTEKDLFSFLSVMNRIQYEPGEIVIQEGETATSAYFVLNGELSLSMFERKTKHYSKGSFFGEIGLIDSRPRMGTICADENSNLLKIEASDLENESRVSPHISTGLKENKFGISHKEVQAIYKLALELPAIEPVGIGFHIGSQLTTIQPFKDATKILVQLAHKVKALGVDLKYIDLGGGLGIKYNEENPPERDVYVKTICELIDIPDIKLIFEPGRSIVGNAGFLVTRILYRKENEGKTFYICDAGMNDLVRPVLYQGYHKVYPVKENTQMGESETDLVGPICETGDFLARSRILPCFEKGDLATLASSGAYCFSMSSNYNARTRAAEVLIKDNSAILVRKRESYEDLIRGESV